MKEKNTVGFVIKLIALVGLVTGSVIYSLGFGSSTVVQNSVQGTTSGTPGVATDIQSQNQLQNTVSNTIQNAKTAIKNIINKGENEGGEGAGDDNGGESASVPKPVSVPSKTVVTPTPTPVATKETAGTSVYKDGTYTAVGSYDAPGGTEQITITLTIRNDIVTDASGVAGSYDRTSLRYENAFLSGFKQYVVGKNISSLQLGRVSGASLTPQGFNDALSQIKSQAKA